MINAFGQRYLSNRNGGGSTGSTVVNNTFLERVPNTVIHNNEFIFHISSPSGTLTLPYTVSEFNKLRINSVRYKTAQSGKETMYLVIEGATAKKDASIDITKILYLHTNSVLVYENNNPNVWDYESYSSESNITLLSYIIYIDGDIATASDINATYKLHLEICLQ